MSDWPEARKRLEQLATSTIVGVDIRAALAEIDRLTTLVQACGKTECVPLAALDATEVQRYAALKEIDRLQAENTQLREELDAVQADIDEGRQR